MRHVLDTPGIIVKIDEMLTFRGMKLKQLAKDVDLAPQNLTKLKNGRAKEINLFLLYKLCVCLDCQPGDLLQCVPD